MTKLNQIVRLNWHEMNMLESRCQQQCLCLCVLVCVPNKLLNTVWIDSVDTIAAVAQSIQIWLHRFTVFPLVIDEMCSICCARVFAFVNWFVSVKMWGKRPDKHCRQLGNKLKFVEKHLFRDSFSLSIIVCFSQSGRYNYHCLKWQYTMLG